MCSFRVMLYVSLLLSGVCLIASSQDVGHHSGHRLRLHRTGRRHRATNDGAFRFEPEPYSKKLELNGSGKIHCKVAGGVTPTVQWFLNVDEPLPEGVTSSNGTLMVTNASRRHAGQYTCKATDGDKSITSKINLDIVVSPRVLEPSPGQQVHVAAGQQVHLNCRASGDPPPTTHWDRNLTILHQQQDGVDIEDGANATNARLVLLNNGTLLIRKAIEEDSDRYGCTAGSAAGLARNDLVLIVHPGGYRRHRYCKCTAKHRIMDKGHRQANSSPDEGELFFQESGGVGGKAIVVTISVAGAYIVLVLGLLVYCRRRKLSRRQRGEKIELEMAEGREKLVEEGEEEKQKTEARVANGAPQQNGRLLPHDRDSGADNSEVSAISRASKKSGQFDHLSVPRSLLTDVIALGRGEFGDVMIAKVDVCQLKKLRNKDEADAEPKMKAVLIKVLSTKDEIQLAEFRRQIDIFSRVRQENVVRLYGLCNEMDPHYMLLEHTDWGDLKSFLVATRTEREHSDYLARIGATAAALEAAPRRASPPTPAPAHRALLATHLASALRALATERLTHRDVAARNCVITSRLHLKLTYAALSRGPRAHEYYKLHDQVIPLRWLPAEAVLEGEYSTKSDVYMFAATVWEIFTKAELPFAKLNDNSVVERLRAGTLDWPKIDAPERLTSLLKRCWSKSPTDRPQFDHICEEMTAIVQDATADNASRQSHEQLDEIA